MKKKLLTFVLCAFLCVGAVVFSACGNSGYDLSDFAQDYAAIATDLENVTTDDGYIEFDFSQITSAIKDKEEDDNYTSLLENYSTLSKNSQRFIVYVQGTLSNEDISSTKRNNIQSQLSTLSSAVVEIDNQITEFARIIANTAYTDNSRTYRLNLLVSAFLDLYNACRDLSFSIAEVYFEDIIVNENYNYYTNSTNYSTNLLSSLTDLTNYQIFNLTQVYIETNLDGASDVTVLNDFADDYETTIRNLEYYLGTISSLTITEDDSLYNLAVELYTLNSQILNERELYLNACNSVSYVAVKEVQSDYTETSYVQIIEGYSQIVEQFTTVLTRIYGELG